MKPLWEPTMSVLPSAETSQSRQLVLGKLLWAQVLPESAEVRTCPVLAIAIRVLPSAEEAAFTQEAAGALVHRVQWVSR